MNTAIIWRDLPGMTGLTLTLRSGAASAAPLNGPEGDEFVESGIEPGYYIATVTEPAAKAGRMWAQVWQAGAPVAAGWSPPLADTAGPYFLQERPANISAYLLPAAIQRLGTVPSSTISLAVGEHGFVVEHAVLDAAGQALDLSAANRLTVFTAAGELLQQATLSNSELSVDGNIFGLLVAPEVTAHETPLDSLHRWSLRALSPEMERELCYGSVYVRHSAR